MTLYLTIIARTFLESSVSKSRGYRKEATSEQLNGTQKPQLSNRGNGMSETKGEKTESKDGKTFQQHRQKSKAQMSLVLHNLFNNITWLSEGICTIYQIYWTVVYSGTGIMNVTYPQTSKLLNV